MDTDSDIVRAAAGLCKELNYDLKGKNQDIEGLTEDLIRPNAEPLSTQVYTTVSDAAMRAALMTHEESQPLGR